MAKQKQVFVAKGDGTTSDWVTSAGDKMAEVFNHEDSDFSSNRMTDEDFGKQYSRRTEVSDSNIFEEISYKGQKVAWFGISQTKDEAKSDWSKVIFRDDSIQITFILANEFKNTAEEKGWTIPVRWARRTKGINESAMGSLSKLQNSFVDYVDQSDFGVKYVISRSGKLNFTKIEEQLESIKTIIIDKDFANNLDSFNNLNEFDYQSALADLEFNGLELTENYCDFGCDNDKGKINKVVTGTATWCNKYLGYDDDHKYNQMKNSNNITLSPLNMSYNNETNTYNNVGFNVNINVATPKVNINLYDFVHQGNIIIDGIISSDDKYHIYHNDEFCVVGFRHNIINYMDSKIPASDFIQTPNNYLQFTDMVDGKLYNVPNTNGTKLSFSIKHIKDSGEPASYTTDELESCLRYIVGVIEKFTKNYF
jgi:hypothetical protein